MSVAHLFVLLCFSGLLLIPLWRIVARAGYPGALALLIYIPSLNLGALWALAFVPWPAERRARP